MPVMKKPFGKVSVKRGLSEIKRKRNNKETETETAPFYGRRFLFFRLYFFSKLLLLRLFFAFLP